MQSVPFFAFLNDNLNIGQTDICYLHYFLSSKVVRIASYQYSYYQHPIFTSKYSQIPYIPPPRRIESQKSQIFSCSIMIPPTWGKWRQRSAWFRGSTGKGWKDMWRIKPKFLLVSSLVSLVSVKQYSQIHLWHIGCQSTFPAKVPRVGKRDTAGVGRGKRALGFFAHTQEHKNNTVLQSCNTQRLCWILFVEASRILYINIKPQRLFFLVSRYFRTSS